MCGSIIIIINRKRTRAVVAAYYDAPLRPKIAATKAYKQNYYRMFKPGPLDLSPQSLSNEMQLLGEFQNMYVLHMGPR